MVEQGAWLTQGGELFRQSARAAGRCAMVAGVAEPGRLVRIVSLAGCAELLREELPPSSEELAAMLAAACDLAMAMGNAPLADFVERSLAYRGLR